MSPRPGHARRANAEQLRDAIDSGTTHDKVKGSDPAAAPMDSDAEAAGTPTPAKALTAAARQEKGGPPEEPRDPMKETSTSKPFALLYTGAVVLFLAVFIIVIWLAA